MAILRQAARLYNITVGCSRTVSVEALAFYWLDSCMRTIDAQRICSMYQLSTPSPTDCVRW